MMNFPGVTFLILCGSLVSVLSLCPVSDRVYTIKLSTKDFVVDGSDTSQVKIQPPNSDSKNQQWRIVCGVRTGVYTLINIGNGYVLDAERTVYPHKAVMGIRDGSTWQEWFLHLNGRLFNAALRQNLEVKSSNFTAGASVYMYYDNGDSNQEWVLEEVDV